MGRLARVLPAAFVVAGAAIRVEQYVARRSLWLDEALLALNVVHRDYRGLLHPLASQQGAPIGFLWLERTAVLVFGNNEDALRLVPLLAGLASLLLFAWLARRLLPPGPGLVALALVALSPPLVYYSTEVKQYAVDVLATLALLATAVALAQADEPLPRRRVIASSALAAALVWFSHAALFAVVGGFGFFAVRTLGRRRPRGLAPIVLAAMLPAASLGVDYVVSLRGLASNPFLLGFWSAGFPPRPLAAGSAVRWAGRATLALFSSPGGLRFSGLAAALAVGGAAALIVRRRPGGVAVLAFLPVVLAAAVDRRYPLQGRLALFLVPTLLLLLASSLAWRGLVAVVAGALVAVVAIRPIHTVAAEVAHPVRINETKPVLVYLRDHQQRGDAIWLHYGTQAAFDYYAPILGMRAGGIVDVVPAPCPAPLILPTSTPRRVWLVLGYHPGHAPADEDALILSRLDTVGRRVEQINRYHAYAVLYDLSQRPSDPTSQRARPYPGGACLRVDPPEPVVATGLRTGPFRSGRSS